MKINYENLPSAIAALYKCARENENKQTGTGAIRVSDLCCDVAAFLAYVKEEHDIPKTNIKLQKLETAHRFSKDNFQVLPADKQVLRREVVKLFLDRIADTDLVEVLERTDPVNGFYDIIASIYVGVKDGVDMDKVIKTMNPFNP